MDEAGRTWWISRAGEREGPFSRTELCALADSGQLLASDRLWKPGLAMPVRAATVGGIAWPAQPQAPWHAWWRPWLVVWLQPWQALKSAPAPGAFALSAVLLASAANSIGHVAGKAPGSGIDFAAGLLRALPLITVLSLLALELQLAVMLTLVRWLDSSVRRAELRHRLYLASFPQALGLVWWAGVALARLTTTATAWPGIATVLHEAWGPLHALLDGWGLLVMVSLCARLLTFTIPRTVAVVLTGVVLITLLSWVLGFAGATIVGLWQVTPVSYRPLLVLAVLAVSLRIVWRWRHWMEV